MAFTSLESRLFSTETLSKELSPRVLGCYHKSENFSKLWYAFQKGVQIAVQIQNTP